MLTEHAWDRKFGEPLPTLEDVMAEASQDDEDYVSIGWGKYKEKDSVDDPTAPTFKKDDSGAFIPAKGADKGKQKEPSGDQEKPKLKKFDSGDFERDFDDSEPEDKPHGGDTGKDADFGAVDGPSPEDGDWDSEQVMTAKLDGVEVGDIIDQGEDHPNYDKAMDYVLQFDPDDEKLYTGTGWKGHSGAKDETVIINGKKYRPIKEKNNG